MRNIWQSLAWKEWNEHKWKLLSLSIVLVGVNTLLLANGRLDRPDVLESLYALTACCAIPLAIFVGATEAAGEKSRGTAQYLEAQPLSLRKVAAFKLAAGLLTIVAPIVIAFVFIYFWFQFAWLIGTTTVDPRTRDGILFQTPFDFDNWYVESGLIIVLVAGSIYLWTAAYGVDRSDEISAAARGAVVIAMWWAALLGIYNFFFADSVDWLRTNGHGLKTAVQAVSPGGVGMMSERVFTSRPEVGQLLAERNKILFAGVASHLCLAWLFVRAYGRGLSDSVASRAPAAPRADQIDWLGPPRRSPFTAIAWKQFRESGSIALAGLACILLIVAVMTAAMWNRLELREVFHMYFGATISMGMFITLVVGIGVMLHDTSPRLHTFWRSRPIDPDLWFWTKFATGLAVVVVAIYLPLLIAGMIGGRDEFWRKLSDSESRLLPAITLGIYISAVTMTALVRQAIYAAILSIAALYIGPLLVEMGTTIASRLIWGETPGPFFESVNGPLMVAAMCAIALVTLLVGWLAVRYDWGRKNG